MPSSYAKLTLIGHLGQDVTRRALPNGDAVADFSVAVSHRRKDAPEITIWYRVSTFGNLADKCAERLHKGSYVYVEGTPSMSEWTDREGAKRTNLDVRANVVQFLDAKDGPRLAASPTEPDFTIDGIPF